MLGGDGATAYFRTGSFAAGARLVQAISELPGVDDQRPAIDVRRDGVTVRMITFTKDYAGMTHGPRRAGPQDLGSCPKAGPVRRPVGGPEPACHPGRDRYRRGDAVLAGRARL